jgi:hypothetical protein
MNDWIDQIKNVFCVKERERESTKYDENDKDGEKRFPSAKNILYLIYLPLHAPERCIHATRSTPSLLCFGRRR